MHCGFFFILPNLENSEKNILFGTVLKRIRECRQGLSQDGLKIRQIDKIARKKLDKASF